MKSGSVNKIILYGVVKHVDVNRDSAKIQVGVSETFSKGNTDVMHEELINVVVPKSLIKSDYTSLFNQLAHIEGKICTIPNWTVETGNTYYTYILASMLRLSGASVSHFDSSKVAFWSHK